MQEIGKTRSGLQMGYTTGSCAAAAAKAAAEMLLSGSEIRQVRLMTPKGIELYLEVEEIQRTPSKVTCAIRKYSGDDPDVTNGLLVYARVRKTEEAVNRTEKEKLDVKLHLDTGEEICYKIGQYAFSQGQNRLRKHNLPEFSRQSLF